MKNARFIGLFLIVVAIAVWAMPYYGYVRATSQLVVAAVAAIAGLTLLFRGRRTGAGPDLPRL